MEDLDDVLDELPERLILGVGAYGGRIQTRPRSPRCSGAGSPSGVCAPTTRSAATSNLTNGTPPQHCTSPADSQRRDQRRSDSNVYARMLELA
jgi:hypothetical protein